VTQRFGRKPQPVEARRFQPTTWEEFREIAAWAGVEPHYYVMEPGDRTKWFLSVDSHRSVNQGDWVLRRDDGTFHQMTHAMFTEEYEIDPGASRG
jgi:hypothetical protein